MDPLEAQFVCVRCKGALRRTTEALACRSCEETYPVIAGSIPVLLPRDDRAGLEGPLHRAEQLAAVPGDFARLVDEYYELCLRGQVTDALFDYYRDITRSRRVGDVSDELAMISLALDMFGAALPTTRRVVEFGSGWGFSMAAMARVRSIVPALRDATLCGFDLDPCILVVARRLFADLGLQGLYVAVADARLPLPFPPKSVDLIYSNGVVEHILEQDALMASLNEALSDESILHFLIPNRYMIHPEPHYNLRGVGFLPRRFLQRYVSWRLGVKEVEYILSYSPRDLARLMGRHFGGDLLGAIPMRPRFPGLLTRLVAENLLGLLAVNGYHCVVRRTRAAGPYEAGRRGKLMLADYPNGPRARCARVYRAA